MRRRLPLIAFCVISVSPAAALDLPARKVGLWEVKMTADTLGMPPTTMQQCIDAATDKMMNSIGGGMRQELCSKQDVRKTGSTITVDSVCQVGGMTITSQAVITGDFNSAYTMKVSSKRSGGPSIPGMPADGTSNTTLDAKWQGACKAGQQPGDIIMADGRKMNVRDFQNMPGMGGRPPGAPGGPQKK
jgi:Protein of unknown function (DUF3617)